MNAKMEEEQKAQMMNAMKQKDVKVEMTIRNKED